MRALAVAAAALALGGACADARSSSGGTRLTIVAWLEGPDGAVRRWTLRCAPAAGTLPRPGRACLALSRLQRPFAPVPRDTACAEIFGGPQEALVRGRYLGRAVWARFDRRDGCQIERWNRHRFLFPIAVGET